MDDGGILSFVGWR